MDHLKYIFYSLWHEIGDARATNFPLMSCGPLPVIMIVASYLYFIRIYGPRMMDKREPYDLKWTIRLYNLIMSSINFYYFWRTSGLTHYGIRYFGCKKVGFTHEENQLVYISYLYFISKILELLDTVFFILRKKPNQASNLHVFHHAFIVCHIWVYFRTAPGGSSFLFAYLNSGIHTVMYGYYFLATFKSLQKFLWWKRYLTMAQIIQFVTTGIHFSYLDVSHCEYPLVLTIIGFFFNAVFLVLFCNLYYDLYLKKKTDEPTKQIKQDSAKAKSSSGVGPAGKQSNRQKDE